MLYQMIKDFFSTTVKDEEGQGLVEYALILVLIAIAVIVILGVMGGQIDNIFSTVSSALSMD